MSRHVIDLAPQRCDKCMRCLRVCSPRAIEVSTAFVFIDRSRCDGCGKCAAVCEAGAIRARAARAGEERRRPERARKLAAAPRSAAAPMPAAAPRPAPTPEPREQPAALSAEKSPALKETVGEKAVTASAEKVAEREPRLRVVRSSDAGRDFDEPTKRPALAHLAPLAPTWEAWEVAAVLGGVAVLFVLQQFALGSDWMTRTVPVGAKPLMRSGILTLYYAAQLAMLAALGYRKRVGFAEAFGLRRFQVTATAAAVVGAVAALRLFAIVYGVAAEGLGWKMPAGPATDLTMYFGRDGVGLGLTILMIVIVGPFFEEVVFRGVMLGYLQERIGAWPAILASALLFAAFHVNAWLFLPIAVMGLAAGWMAVRSRSLWAAYALHLLYNAVPVFLVFALAK